MNLLCIPTRLGLPLLGGSKLRGHICSQPGLFTKAVPLHLLLTEETGFIPATSSDNLQKETNIRSSKNTKTYEERRKQRGRSSRYPGRGNKDLAQDFSGLVQSLHHARDPEVKALPLHALGMIVKREGNRRGIPRGHPLERRLPPRRGAASPRQRGRWRLPPNPVRHHCRTRGPSGWTLLCLDAWCARIAPRPRVPP